MCTMNCGTAKPASYSKTPSIALCTRLHYSHEHLQQTLGTASFQWH